MNIRDFILSYCGVQVVWKDPWLNEIETPKFLLQLTEKWNNRKEKFCLKYLKASWIFWKLWTC